MSGLLSASTFSAEKPNPAAPFRRGQIEGKNPDKAGPARSALPYQLAYSLNPFSRPHRDEGQIDDHHQPQRGQRTLFGKQGEKKNSRGPTRNALPRRADASERRTAGRTAKTTPPTSRHAQMLCPRRLRHGWDARQRARRQKPPRVATPCSRRGDRPTGCCPHAGAHWSNEIGTARSRPIHPAQKTAP